MRHSPIRTMATAALAAVLLIPGLTTAPASAHPDCEEQGSDGSVESEVNRMLGQEEECEGHGELEQGEDTTVAESSPVGPAVSTFTWSDNMTPLGYSARNVPTSGAGSAQFNSDLAFWGDLAFQGTYDGFRILDVSDPTDPTQIVNYTQCASSAGQGDVVVWGNLLVRSWDAPANASASCGGQLVGQGFEGVHLFDISNPANPVLIRGVRMASNTTPAGCGSHTATIVPDAARGNVYLYVGGSSSSCTGIDIVRIPIANPQDAAYLRRASASRQCHDNNVIMGDVNLAVCAGGNGFSVLRFDPTLDPDAAGGIASPTLVYSMPVTGVSIGHSASFTYDGEVLIFGHEPGGGSQAQCQSTSSVVNRSIYFFDPLTGTQLGTFVHPRPQSSTENCTWHNFNVVPSDKGYVYVSGNYQSGISVVDFTNPAAAREIAFADPAPLSSSSLILGGDWSSYWYDGHIYESDIRRGVLIWKLDHDLVNRARRLGRANPQTQETSFTFDTTAPEIDIASPVDGAEYGLDSVVHADFTCEDPESGVERCVGTVEDGAAIDTSAVGTHTFTVEATDVAGNTATASVTYRIVWPFEGFFAPIEAEPTVNVAQAGSAVPVKFDLGGNRGLDIFQPGHPRSDPLACGLGGSEDPVEETVTAGGSSLVYGDGHYTYVWKTEQTWANSCRQLVVTLVDGSRHTATFRFR